MSPGTWAHIVSSINLLLDKRHIKAKQHSGYFLFDFFFNLFIFLEHLW